MVKIVPYTPDHLEKIRLKDIYAGENIQAVGVPAVTFLVGDQPIAILGWILPALGIMQVMALISDDVRKVPLAFHKSVRNIIQYAFTVYKLRRMQMSVWCGYMEGYQWAKSLGFECEGIMKNYRADRQPCWLFARYA